EEAAGSSLSSHEQQIDRRGATPSSTPRPSRTRGGHFFCCCPPSKAVSHSRALCRASASRSEPKWMSILSRPTPHSTSQLIHTLQKRQEAPLFPRSSNKRTSQAPTTSGRLLANHGREPVYAYYMRWFAAIAVLSLLAKPLQAQKPLP